MAEETVQGKKGGKGAVRRRTLSGVVVSRGMKDSVVVAVTRYVKHSKYKKYVKRVKRYLAHDAGNTQEVGDRVVIEETKPISKNKHFRVVKVGQET
jgi:small subunit ribosomal protein S17